MRLTRFSDYAVRALLYLSARADRRCSVTEIAQAYDISQNHLMKVISDLASAGYVDAQRGRGGGLRLARPASEINLGKLLRHTQGEARLTDCPTCGIRAACQLAEPFGLAVDAFYAVLERYTLDQAADADMLGQLTLAPASFCGTGAARSGMLALG